MNQTQTTGKQLNTGLILPVLFSFFVMGFVDIVGTATLNIKTALGLSNTLAGLLPNFILIWFLVLSIPVGILMSRIGRKKTVQLSNIITIIGMLIPLPMILSLVETNLVTYLLTFVMLGIGNTIIQVSLNPLLTNVTPVNRLTSFMTLGQFVKAISSLLGPQFVLFATVSLNNWNYVFLIYAGVTVLSSLWLMLAPIPAEEKSSKKPDRFSQVIALLKDRTILSYFFCILLIVGIDVGLNFFIPVIFREIYAMEHAASMNTLYFGARAVGSFICALLLARFPSRKIFFLTMIVAIAAYVVMISLTLSAGGSALSKTLFTLMFLPVGFATANVFAIVFSFALQHKPEKADQISSLLIMGVAGGGATTLLMGIIADHIGITGGMSVLLPCMIYILIISILILRKKPDEKND